MCAIAKVNQQGAQMPIERHLAAVGLDLDITPRGVVARHWTPSRLIARGY